MEPVTCPQCGSDVPRLAACCAKCGRPMRREQLLLPPQPEPSWFEEFITQAWRGGASLDIACPNCRTLGQVRTKTTTRNRGLSAAKAAAAVLTGGLSILIIGLMRKESVRQAHCYNCSATWDL